MTSGYFTGLFFWLRQQYFMDRLRERRKMKKIALWKVLAAVLAALIIYDILTVVSFVSAAESVEVPPEVEEISVELGNAYGICPETIQAVCWVESRFQADAVNDDCTGIMQVSDKWHKDRMDRLGVTDLKDVRGNITVGVDFLAELVEEGEDMEKALMRYHGESRIGQRLEAGEMSEYVDKVLSVSEMLERRNGK